jgi:hypothetical protein
MQGNMSVSEESKLRSPDRVLVLEQIEGKNPRGGNGIIDPRLFKGGEDANRLHAKMDMETCLWSLHYEKGAVPPALQGLRFTGFKKAKQFAEEYFAKRNVKITEVKD